MSTIGNQPLDENFSLPEWLTSLGLDHYASVLVTNGITPDILFTLSDSDLEKCGIASMSARKRLLLGIEQLKVGPAPQVADVRSVSIRTVREPISQNPTATSVQAGNTPKKNKAAPTVPAMASKRSLSIVDRYGGRFLYISIIAHVVFGLIATWFVVQRLEAKRKTTFLGAQPLNQRSRAIEHRVQMTKQKNTMSAPSQSKRITTTAITARVAIPAMKMPMSNDLDPSRMAGIGVAFGTVTMGGGPGTGGRGSIPFFGLRNNSGGLQGSLYDLKQTTAGSRSPINNISLFVNELNRFVTTGWQESFFSKYFKAPQPLYATQIFVPLTPSINAPKEFGVENEVKPSFWMALYKGKVSPPESGTYYFVGAGDNILIVRLSGKVVMDRSWNYKEVFGMDKNWKPTAIYDYGWGLVPGGFAKGLPMQLSSMEYYDMEILIGDDGGTAHFSLLVEKEGVNYEKTKAGLPILPVFRLSQDQEPSGDHPPFLANGPVWKSRKAPEFKSVFAH